jgi:hypothetical protein
MHFTEQDVSMRTLAPAYFVVACALLLSACDKPVTPARSFDTTPPTSTSPLAPNEFPLCAMDPWDDITGGSGPKPVIAKAIGENLIAGHHSAARGYTMGLPIEVGDNYAGASHTFEAYVNARTQQAIGPSGHRELLDKTLGPIPTAISDALPDNYDLRQIYPNCANISANYDQGQCGSCWAHAAAGALADNACVQYSLKTPGTPPSEIANLQLSPQFFMDCALGHKQTSDGNSVKSAAFGCQGGQLPVAYDFAKKGIPSLECRPGLFETSLSGALSCAGFCGCLRCSCEKGSDIAIASHDVFTLFSNNNNYVFAATSNPNPASDPSSDFTCGEPNASGIAQTPCRYCEERCEYTATPFKGYKVANVLGIDQSILDAMQVAKTEDQINAAIAEGNNAMKHAIMTYGSISIGIAVPISFMFYKSGTYQYTGWITYSVNKAPQACNVVADCQNSPNLPKTVSQFASGHNLSFGCVDQTTHQAYSGSTNGGVCAISDGFEGGHALRVVGWGTDGTTPYWIVANSWGLGWGNKGFFQLEMGGLTAQNVMAYDAVTWAEMDLSNMGG